MWQECWKDLRVGDIVWIKKGQEVPADLVQLSSSDEQAAHGFFLRLKIHPLCDPFPSFSLHLFFSPAFPPSPPSPSLGHLFARSLSVLPPSLPLPSLPPSLSLAQVSTSVTKLVVSDASFLLCSGQGVSYVDTCNLDGETNLKIKSSLSVTNFANSHSKVRSYLRQHSFRSEIIPRCLVYFFF